MHLGHSRQVGDNDSSATHPQTVCQSRHCEASFQSFQNPASRAFVTRAVATYRGFPHLSLKSERFQRAHSLAGMRLKERLEGKKEY